MWTVLVLRAAELRKLCSCVGCSLLSLSLLSCCPCCPCGPCSPSAAAGCLIVPAFALVIKHRRVKAAPPPSQPEQMLFGLWSLVLGAFMCKAEQNTNSPDRPMGLHTSSMGTLNSSQGPTRPFHLGAGKIACVCHSANQRPPPSPLFYLRLKRSRGELIAVRPGADDDMEFLALPQTLT